MKNLNFGNSLSLAQCEEMEIDRQEADDVLAFYNKTMNDMFEINEDDIDTAAYLSLNDDGVPEVAYNIYKGGRTNQQVVNDYESARAVYRHIQLGEDLIDPKTGDIVGE